MDARIKKLLTPELLSSLQGMELVARVVVEGFMTGSNRSRTVGTGQEFSQYRAYEPGDDLRQLDWKMYARSERYFIKQADIETNITVKLFLDSSNSMAYSEEGVSKFDYSKVLAAAIGFLAKKQGDAIGLSILSRENLTHLQPHFAHQHFMRFLHVLVESGPAGRWRQDQDMEHLFAHHGKELIIFVSDLYDENNDILNFLRKLKTRRNEVIVFHITGTVESELNITGSYSFRDLENGTTYQADADRMRSDYLRKFNEWVRETKRALLEMDIHYQDAPMSEFPSDVLRRFINVRSQLM